MQESCLQLSLGVPGALLEIALYVEPRSAALPTQAFTFEKLRGGAINHSQGGMDATNELIFKAFMCFSLRCTFNLNLLEPYYVCYGILGWFE
jgi:hypothetical protein